MSTVTITKNNFKDEVLSSDKPVLIDFWAPWCGPCRMLAPVVDEIASEVDHVKIGKVNIDEESGLAAQFHVMSIPTLIVLKNGKAVKSAVGVQSKTSILKMLEGL
jgi:thioredoxin 1